MPERPRALITGASSGIGADFARQLARRGYDLVLVARRRDRLQALADENSSSAGASSEVVVADLVKQEGLDHVRARLDNGDVELLINNAGFPGYRPFVDLDPNVADDLVRLHVRVPTLLSRAALPHMVRRNRGAVINVASLLYRCPGPSLPTRCHIGLSTQEPSPICLRSRRLSPAS